MPIKSFGSITDRVGENLSRDIADILMKVEQISLDM